MTKKFFFHFFYYLFLFLILFFGVYLLYFFRGLPDKQFLVVCILSFLYFLLGNFFHLLRGDFHLKIMLEYLLIALLALFLLKGAIFR